MIELLRQRRSIRIFKNREIEPDKVAILKEALVRSPSSRNLNPWEFYFVNDCNTLEKLSCAKTHGARFLEGAALAVVITADDSISDVWVEDCSIAAILLQLTAQSLGLGSCWAQIRKRHNEDARDAETVVRECLGLVRPLRIDAIIGIGYPAETKLPIESNTLPWEKVHD